MTATPADNEKTPKALSIKSNFAWNTFGSLTYQFCIWLMTVLVVRLSMTGAYENSGYLAFAMAAGNIFTAIATFNLRSFQVSDNGKYSSRNYSAMRLFTCAAAYVIIILYTLFQNPGTMAFLSVVVFCVFKFDEAFADILYGIDQGASRMDYIGISQTVRGLGIIIVFSITIMFTGNVPLSVLPIGIVGIAVTFLYDIPHAKRISPVAPSISRIALKAMLIECFPVAASLLLHNFAASIVRQFFGIWYGSDMLGIYAAIATPCVIVQVLAAYLYAPCVVPLSESLRNDIDAFWKMLGKLATTIAAATFVCIILAFAFGPSAIELLFGEGVREWSWTFGYAIIAASFMAFDVILMNILIVMRKTIAACVSNAIALISCAALMLPCFAAWSVNGVNIVLIISFGCAVIYAVVYILRQKKLSRIS